MVQPALLVLDGASGLPVREVPLGWATLPLFSQKNLEKDGAKGRDVPLLAGESAVVAGAAAQAAAAEEQQR